MRALVLALVATIALPAFADNPQDAVRARMTEGEERYQNQEYRAAIEAFDAVVHDPVADPRPTAPSPTNTSALSWLILGKKPKARAAFEELLAIDPHYTLSDPSHSPKLREFFDEVRSSFVPGYGKGGGEAELEHDAPTGATAGRPLEMQVVVIRGTPLVHAVTLFARRQGLLEYAATSLRGDGGTLAALVRAAARRRRLHARVLRRGARRSRPRGGARRVARAADPALGARRPRRRRSDGLVQALVRVGRRWRGRRRRRHRRRRGRHRGKSAARLAAAGHGFARAALLRYGRTWAQSSGKRRGSRSRSK